MENVDFCAHILFLPVGGIPFDLFLVQVCIIFK